MHLRLYSSVENYFNDKVSKVLEGEEIPYHISSLIESNFYLEGTQHILITGDTEGIERISLVEGEKRVEYKGRFATLMSIRVPDFSALESE